VTRREDDGVRRSKVLQDFLVAYFRFVKTAPSCVRITVAVKADPNTKDIGMTRPNQPPRRKKSTTAGPYADRDSETHNPINCTSDKAQIIAQCRFSNMTVTRQIIS
jgi:hypothetical protein